jgi:F0F1-type ATP synthase membrane subunit b/b'
MENFKIFVKKFITNLGKVLAHILGLPIVWFTVGAGVALEMLSKRKSTALESMNQTISAEVKKTEEIKAEVQSIQKEAQEEIQKAEEIASLPPEPVPQEWQKDGDFWKDVR